MTPLKRIALVTGGSRGIGHAIVKKLAEQENLIIIGTATTKEGASRITNALAENNFDGQGMVLDVTSLVSIEKLFNELKEIYNATPLILINNAAVTADNLLLRMKDTEWNKVIETNLNSVFRMTKLVLREMLKAHFGRIINIGSVVGTTGNAGQVNYSAAKAGLIGFSKALAQEVGSRNITVNVISPGFIDTDMTNVLSKEQRENLLKHIPLGRLGKPEDIAALTAFLVSAEGAYITGQNIHVNGGMY